MCACAHCHSTTHQIVLVRKHRGVVHDSSQQVYLGEQGRVIGGAGEELLGSRRGLLEEQARSYWGSRRGVIEEQVRLLGEQARIDWGGEQARN